MNHYRDIKGKNNYEILSGNKNDSSMLEAGNDRSVGNDHAENNKINDVEEDEMLPNEDGHRLVDEGLLVEELKDGNMMATRSARNKIQSTLHQIRTTQTYQRMIYVMKWNCFQDCAVQYRGVILIADGAIVKLFKFIALTLFFLFVTHSLVRSLDWEHDPSYMFSDFLLYDLHSVMLDTIVFFIVGRLFSSDRPGIDQLMYILPLLFGTIYPSWTNTWGFLRHSVSMYEIMCRWPATLFEYVLGVAALDIYIIYLHLRDALARGVILSKTIELLLSIILFIAPMAGNPSFHLHHWFAAWLLGMHANSKDWWSRGTQAFLWGMYINGIAVYGRDPILGCAYSYYTSTSNFCNFMSCSLKYDDDDSVSDSGDNIPHYQPFIAPNWHNCSAG